MKLFIGIWVLCFCLMVSSSKAEKRPNASFLKDSVQLGEQVTFSLSYAYPRDWNVYFPDSTFGFGDFEWESRDYFSTTEISGDSLLDSVHYSLQSFELGPFLILSAPVFRIFEEDTSTIWSNRDSVFIIEEIPVLTDSLELISDTSGEEVSTNFNYPRFFWALGLLSAIILFVLVFFGKTIAKFFRLKRMEKANEKFLIQFEELISISSPDSKKMEEIKSFWAIYMERVSDNPFSKWTTKEIFQNTGDKELGEFLKAMDGLIYGGLNQGDWKPGFKLLKTLSQSAYELRREEVKGGK